jgi:AraC family transcriptional regulator
MTELGHLRVTLLQDGRRTAIVAKVAVDLEQALARRRQHGAPGGTSPRVVARGEGWAVADVVCTSGPQDRPFEERHARYTIAVVVAGSFQYRSGLGRGMMTPGSLMLGNEGLHFECGHEHGEGDRCVAFWYAPDYFERLATDLGLSRIDFAVPRLPPLRSLSPLVAHAAAGAVDSSAVSWEELGVRLAASALRLGAGASPDPERLPLNAEALVSRSVRTIAQHLDAPLTLEALARENGLSSYHFLRTFERVAGVTPHQFVLRARLRDAATRLLTGAEKVVDIALDSGFGDVSNFNRAFRTEFGVSPRAFRRNAGLRSVPARF